MIPDFVEDLNIDMLVKKCYTDNNSTKSIVESVIGNLSMKKLFIWLISIILASTSFWTIAFAQSSTVSLGVDYSPNHYPDKDGRNYQASGNMYPELKQLKAAGFNTVRMYGQPAINWIKLIKYANQLKMYVVYQLALCQADNTGACLPLSQNKKFSDNLTYEIAKLKQVIDRVGVNTFLSTVKLILVGNEIFWNSGSTTNGQLLANAISSVQKNLPSKLKNVLPISISLQADVWVCGNAPKGSCAIKKGLDELASALPTGSPITINVYPFQWQKMTASSAIGSGTYTDDPLCSGKDGGNHSIACYVQNIHRYYKKPIAIAETGWASAGDYVVCGQGVPLPTSTKNCLSLQKSDPSRYGACNCVTGNINNAQTYYSALYNYIKSNPVDENGKAIFDKAVPLLAFMAFDQPTKTTVTRMLSENNYGVFNMYCALKKSNSADAKNLLPNGENYNNAPSCIKEQSIFTFNGMLSDGNLMPSAFNLKIIKKTNSNYNFTDKVKPFQQTMPGNTKTPIWGYINLAVGDKVSLEAGGQTLCSNTVTGIGANNTNGSWEKSGIGLTGCEQVNWVTNNNIAPSNP